MGLHLSMPECNLPSRTFIGVGNSRAIVNECARHRVAYAIGFTAVIALALLGAVAYTQHENTKFKVPLWLCALPVFFCLVYAFSQLNGAEQELQGEEIYQQLSGMSKKDFLNYRVGDDRANKSFASSAMSSSILSGSNIMGPFLRSDR